MKKASNPAAPGNRPAPPALPPLSVLDNLPAVLIDTRRIRAALTVELHQQPDPFLRIADARRWQLTRAGLISTIATNLGLFDLADTAASVADEIVSNPISREPRT